MNKIGIDAGGSLIKVVYEEHGRFHFKTFPIEEAEKMLSWLEVVSPHARIHLTGGKSGNLSLHIKNQREIFDEFQAAAKGARYLLVEEKREEKPFILVSIGTGTSIFYVDQNHFERVSGTGIGGGTLMGLGYMLTDNNNFSELVGLAEAGKRESCDLLVKDIYAPSPPPIPGDLTAANFGKAHKNPFYKKEDAAAALVQLIAETIVLLSGEALRHKQVNRLVFIGSTLEGNRPLKNAIANFQPALQSELIFLDKGAYSGALGAYLLG